LEKFTTVGGYILFGGMPLDIIHMYINIAEAVVSDIIPDKFIGDERGMIIGNMSIGRVRVFCVNKAWPKAL
jgi:hypothetical protein